jgi:hypothetical protein
MSEPLSVTFTPGTAYWNQRFEVQRTSGRLQTLAESVDHSVVFSLVQFAQFFAVAREFAPDLIIELGRGYGNSTCAFIEAANQLPSPCRIVSVCDCSFWHEVTVPRLLPAMGSDWFQPLQAVEGDIRTFDFEPVLEGARRVLIFWDAHGFDIAECVLGKLLRLAAAKDHLVLLHDMSDLRYCGQPDPNGDYPLWSGDHNGAGRFCIGNLCSKVPQAISVVDFITRNGLTLESADHSIHTTIAKDPQKKAEMQELLGPMYSPDAHWFWFTLNEHPGPYKFPAVESR